MKNNKKWFLAVGMAAVLAVNGLVGFAAEQQDGANSKPARAAHGKFDQGINYHREQQAKLLELLKIDQDTFQTAMRDGKTLVAIAAEQGVSEQELKDFMVKNMTQRIDAAVQAGRISAAQAETKKANLDERVTKMINSKRPMHAGPRHGHGFANNPKLLELLKIDADQLKTAMHDGKTLAAVAQEQGISEQELKDFMVKDFSDRIEAGVKAGRISADKAAKMKADIDVRIDDMINGKMPQHGHGPMPRPDMPDQVKQSN